MEIFFYLSSTCKYVLMYFSYAVIELLIKKSVMKTKISEDNIAKNENDETL